MNELTIESLQNPKIKQLIKLRDRRDRDKLNLFLIEGYRELLRALESAYKISALFVCPKLFLGSNESTLIDKAKSQGATIYFCTEQVFRKISYRDRPDGILAIAPQAKKGLTELEKLLSNKPSPLLVIAEAIEKPGNLGTILRSSDAVKVDALIVCDKCTDIFNPNVVRASVGTLFTVPVIEATTEEMIPWLKEKGIKIVAATPSATQEYTEINMKEAVAIAVGTEQLGLSQAWLKNADLSVKIPMLGKADSLNVAMATTILMYEAIRQRRS